MENKNMSPDIIMTNGTMHKGYTLVGDGGVTVEIALGSKIVEHFTIPEYKLDEHLAQDARLGFQSTVRTTHGYAFISTTYT